MISSHVTDRVEQHRATGRTFEAGGVRSFVRERGEGPTVVPCTASPQAASCIARWWTSSRPEDCGQLPSTSRVSGSRLARATSTTPGAAWPAWTATAIDALEIESCHLVVHDIGGPIGFEWAIRHHGRVTSLTALNTFVDVAGFRRPWPMPPFAVRGVGELWLAGLRRPVWRSIFRHVALGEQSAISDPEIDSDLTLLKRDDGGRAFLRIMRGFELTAAKQRFLFEGLSARDYPAQVVWGRDDRSFGRATSTRRAAGARRRPGVAAGHEAFSSGGPGSRSRRGDRRAGQVMARASANPFPKPVPERSASLAQYPRGWPASACLRRRGSS